MATWISCPDCGASIPLSDPHAGPKVRCTKCDAVFPVPALKPLVMDRDESLDLSARPIRISDRHAPVDADDLLVKRASTSPKLQAPARSSRWPWLVGGTVLALVLVVGIVTAAWLLSGGGKPDPDGLSARGLDELKAATVFVKVTAGPIRASGSGFVIHVEGNTGYVVTNDHVVYPQERGNKKERRGSVPAGQVTLVFGSGTKQEQTVPAEVVAGDEERDLAVLKVTGLAHLPRPIAVSQAANLKETLPVTVFGFPFGEALAVHEGNPAITVSKGSISSIRRNKQDEIAAVQIDGALNPGNSGGPVVDPDGRLVGIAVATIRGTHIGLAIPAGELAKVFSGRVGPVRARARSTGMNAEVEVEVPVIDPLRRVDAVTLHYLRADLVKANPAPDQAGNWPKLAGAQRLVLRRDGLRAVGTFAIPVAEVGQAITFQTSYVNVFGQPVCTEPRPVEFRPEVPAADVFPPGLDQWPPVPRLPRPRIPRPPRPRFIGPPRLRR